MTEKLICIDYKNDQGDWQKNWTSLYDSTHVLTLQNAEKLDAELILIHQSAIGNFANFENQAFVDIREKTDACIGIVSTDGCSNSETSMDGKCYRLQTSFPKALDHLKGKVAGLIEELQDVEKLEEAKKTGARKRAWARFDTTVLPNENLIALSFLCQGYLATGALKEGLEPHAASDVGVALVEMGWAVEDDQDSSILRASSSVSSLELKPSKELPKADYWLGAFGEPEDDSWSNVIAELEHSVKNEWGEDNLPEAASTLLKKIGESVSPKCSLDLNVVAEAFLVFQKRLKAVP